MKKYLLLFAVLLSTLLNFTFPAFAMEDVRNDYSGDVVQTGNLVVSEKDVVGDYISFGQNMSVKGNIGGDILAFSANSMDVLGNVGGNVRGFAQSFTTTGTIERNVTLLATQAAFKETSQLNGNLYLISTSADLLGKIDGSVYLVANQVTLGGTVTGDVSINASDNPFASADGTETITIRPGTIIQGKLICRGLKAPEIPADAKIGSLEFTKVDPQVKTVETKPVITFGGIIKILMTWVALFLLSLILLRISPRHMAAQRDFMQTHPLTAAGIGIAALGTIVASLILLLIVLVLSVFLFKLSVPFFILTALSAFVFLTGMMTCIPVAYWLGSILTGRRESPAICMAAGLFLSMIVVEGLQLLSNIAGPVGSICGVAHWIALIAIWLLGMGAILRGVRDFVKSANQDMDQRLLSPQSPEIL